MLYMQNAKFVSKFYQIQRHGVLDPGIDRPIFSRGGGDAIQGGETSVKLTSTPFMSLVLSGMSLWGFGKKRKEKASRASKAENAAVFPTRSSPPPPSTYDRLDSSTFHFNDNEPYDPQADYAQVLSEAQQCVARTKLSSLTKTTAMPANAKLSRNNSSKPREPNPLEHTAPLKKSKSSWKNIKEALFRQKSKKNVHGYTTSPPSKKTLNRSVSGPLSSYGDPKRRGQQGFSGPLYSVGTRPEPTNKFGRSGFRSGSATPERGCHLESPYELLKSSARQIYEPGHLYTA